MTERIPFDFRAAIEARKPAWEADMINDMIHIGLAKACGATHHTGCACHEARRDAMNGATIRERDEAYAELSEVRDLLGRLRAAFFASDLVKRDVLDDVDAYLSAPLDALTQAAQLDGQYDVPTNQN